MKSNKSGVSMQGTIERTRSKKTERFIKRKDNIKKQNAKVCLNCDDNKEGWCNKYKGWCHSVNYHCNGYKMSYDEKLYQDKQKYLKKKKAKEQKKTQKQLKNKKNKQK